MNKEDITKILIAIGIIVLFVLVLIKIEVITINRGITGASITDSESNIRSASPTPSSCTATQNCGSSTCAVASGRGGGCGGGCGG